MIETGDRINRFEAALARLQEIGHTGVVRPEWVTAPKGVKIRSAFDALLWAAAFEMPPDLRYEVVGPSNLGPRAQEIASRMKNAELAARYRAVGEAADAAWEAAKAACGFTVKQDIAAMAANARAAVLPDPRRDGPNRFGGLRGGHND